jgi:hypothetical protein
MEGSLGMKMKGRHAGLLGALALVAAVATTPATFHTVGSAQARPTFASSTTVLPRRAPETAIERCVSLRLNATRSGGVDPLITTVPARPRSFYREVCFASLFRGILSVDGTVIDTTQLQAIERERLADTSA